MEKLPIDRVFQIGYAVGKSVWTTDYPTVWPIGKHTYGKIKSGGH